MKNNIIEDLIDDNKNKIDFQKLQFFMNEKLNELYQKEKTTPLFDYHDIRYSAMIDLIYEMMPSLKSQ